MKQIFTVFIALFTFFPTIASAQDNTALPKLPAPIQTLVSEGAQVRFLGKDHGFDSWITIKNGQEQYFYVKPDGSAFLMGVLFDEKGKLVTLNQVKRLRESGDDVVDNLTEDTFAGMKRAEVTDESGKAFKTPAERLFHDIENSNWIALGRADAPVAYAFVDPQCPHCHKLVESLRKDKIESGKLQLRLIPVGFKDETRAQSAFLLAAPNPQERWYAHMDGDESALPAKSDISQQGVQRNMSIMQAWEFTVTPMIVYRDKNASVKLIRGNPKDMKAFVADLR